MYAGEGGENPLRSCWQFQLKFDMHADRYTTSCSLPLALARAMGLDSFASNHKKVLNLLTSNEPAAGFRI